MRLINWKNCAIRVFSNRLASTDQWVPKVEIVFGLSKNVTLRQEVIVTRSFASEEEADNYAIEMAKHRIDRELERSS